MLDANELKKGPIEVESDDSSDGPFEFVEEDDVDQLDVAQSDGDEDDDDSEEDDSEESNGEKDSSESEQAPSDPKLATNSSTNGMHSRTEAKPAVGKNAAKKKLEVSEHSGESSEGSDSNNEGDSVDSCDYEDETEPDDSDESVTDDQIAYIVIGNLPGSTSEETVAKWFDKHGIPTESVAIADCAIVKVENHERDVERITSLSGVKLGKQRVAVFHAIPAGDSIEISGRNFSSKSSGNNSTGNGVNSEVSVNGNSKGVLVENVPDKVTDKSSDPKRQRLDESTEPELQPRECTRLFVRNIPFECSQEEFAKCFPGVAVDFPMRNGRSYGHAILQYGSKADAETALESFKQQPIVLRNRQLEIKFDQKPVQDTRNRGINQLNDRRGGPRGGRGGFRGSAGGRGGFRGSAGGRRGAQKRNFSAVGAGAD